MEGFGFGLEPVFDQNAAEAQVPGVRAGIMQPLQHRDGDDVEFAQAVQVQDLECAPTVLVDGGIAVMGADLEGHKVARFQRGKGQDWSHVLERMAG